MIQVISLRPYNHNGKPSQKDSLLKQINSSYSKFFLNIEKVLEGISKEERYNLFYTAFHAVENEKRKFESQSCIIFDIENVNHELWQEYVKTFAKTFSLEQEKLVVINSGNGLHIIVELEEKIKSAKDLKELKPHYQALCSKLDNAFMVAGLSGSTDKAVFDAARIFRLPETENRKPNKETKKCFILQNGLAPQGVDLKKLSGIPTLEKADFLSPKTLKKYPKPNVNAVLDGCLFIKEMVANFKDGKASEPLWYAMLSVTSRLDSDDKTGHQISHELSSYYKHYDHEQTDTKLKQALDASGPRTCRNINSVWGGCSNCPNFEKYASPILIRGENEIRTEGTGFHDIFVTENGKEKIVPNLEDLRLYLKRETHYKGYGDTGMVYLYKDTHYESKRKLYFKEYAYDKFKPCPTNTVCENFQSIVTCTNLTEVSWWNDSVFKRINFQNGYLDLRDINNIKFLAHTPEIGFRYTLPYEFDESAKCPTFEKMLDDVTVGDTDLRNTLIEYMGYALSNDNYWIHKALLLVGEGSNGKSTFVDILKMVAGRDNYSSLNISAMKSETNRQLLDGKLFNISEELDVNAMATTSLFKTITSGGDVYMRSLYNQGYFVTNKTKMIFTCNELPDSKDTSEGYLRRFLIVPFQAKFNETTGNFDPHILEKMKKELPGIFNLAISGYKRLIKNQKFTESKVTKEITQQYKRENNSVQYWANNSLKIHCNGSYDSFFAPINDLYEDYRSRCEAWEILPLSIIKFNKQLKNLIPDSKDRFIKKDIKENNMFKTKKGYQGISIESMM